jgi:hypothetical protein
MYTNSIMTWVGSDLILQRHDYENDSVGPDVSILQGMELEVYYSVRILYVIWHFTLLCYTFLYRTQTSCLIQDKL